MMRYSLPLSMAGKSMYMSLGDAVMRFYAHIVCLLNGTHNKNPLYTMKP